MNAAIAVILRFPFWFEIDGVISHSYKVDRMLILENNQY
jgi:hypothetical protein